MNVNVREAGPFERVVGFQLTDEEIDAAKTVAARRLSQDLKLKGFRPGKAPRPVVEAAVGAERLRTEAIEDAIPPRLTEVLTERDLRPAVNPSLENLEDVDGGVTVEVKVTLWPTLETVPSYRDRTIEIDSPEVSDEELEDQLDRMLEQFGQVEEVERPAVAGDFVSLDMKATVDGVEIEEAAATELLYRIGSGGLVEGADEQLLGTEAGDELSIDSELPEGFGDQGGQQATFTITVNEVKELILPDLTDEWVDDNTEYETVEDLTTSLRERMGEMKRSSLEKRFADRALETLVEQVEIDLPQAVVRSEMDELLHRFIHRLEEQEVSLDDYFEVTGLEREQFLADLEAQANQSVKTRVLLDAVIADAGLQVSDEEFDSVLHAVAGQSEDPMAFLKAIRGTPQELSLRSDMLRDKALATIVENATPVDPNGVEIELDTGPAEVPAGQPVDGEIVEGEVVEGEVVEGAVVAAGSDDEGDSDETTKENV